MNGKQKNNKYNRRGKGKQYSKNQSNKGCKSNDRPIDNDSDIRDGSNNDVSWYLANPALIRDVASYPYAWPLGNKVDLHWKLNDVYSTTSDESRWWMYNNAIPGVMSVHWSPTVGYSDGPDAPINLAARSIYTYVRHVNSGSTNYQSPDLMLYFLAMDSVYAWWSALRRVYGTMMTYSYTNRYYPRVLVQAMGFNYDDLKDNMAQLRAHINTLAVRMGSFAVPASMSYMARHQWMNENVYFDSSSGKGQTYVLVQNKYAKFEYDPETKIGKLVQVNPGTNLTLADITAFTNTLLDPIVWDEDFNIMSGDILKAFGPNGILKTFDTPPEYMVLPVYNEEVLSQIMNSTAYGDFGFDSPGLDDYVTQVIDDLSRDSYLISKPMLSPGNTSAISLGAGQEDRFISFNHDNVTPEQTIVATRLTNIIEPKPGQQGKVIFKTCGSEIVTKYAIYTLGKGTQDTSVLAYPFTSIWDATYQYNAINAGIPTFVEYFNKASDLSRFDWHPCVNISLRFRDMNDNGADTFLYFNSMFDVNNYTVMSARDLEQMSSVIMQNMFAVPLMGAWQGRI